MADYPVSIEKVRKALVELRDSLGERYISIGLSMALAKLEGFTPMDAVPVVRCRECKHMWQASLSGNMYCELHGTCVFVVRPDEYCSRGERKEDDHERKGSDSL